MRVVFFCYRSHAGTTYYGFYRTGDPSEHEHIPVPIAPGAQAMVAAYLSSLWARGIFPSIDAETLAFIHGLPA